MVLIIIVNTKYALHSLENFFLAFRSLRRLRKIFFWLPAAYGNSENFFPAFRSLRQPGKFFFCFLQLAATRKNFF